MSNLVHFPKRLPDKGRIFSGQNNKRSKQLFFTQEEFRSLLAEYSNHVATGEWKDYAIDCLADKACFSIYRHSHEAPIFQISKRKNGKHMEFSLITQHRTIKRSRDVSVIINLLKTPFKLI